MYQIIYTKGDTEKVIAEFSELHEAIAEKLRLESEYDGLLTVQKGGRIYD